MFQTFHPTTKISNIAVCIHDMFDDCKSNYSKEIAVNLTDYMLNRFLKYGYTVFVGTDEDELLKESSSYNFSHGAIIASGTSMKLSDRLIHAIEEKCKEDFFIAGQIQNRDEQYFELHHQFYIINLNEYKLLNSPQLGESIEELHSQIEPLQQGTINSNYVAASIIPSKNIKTYKGKMHGWNIIATAMENNKVVTDVGEQIRNNKSYFYYEYDHVFLRQVSELFYYPYMFNNIVVPFNSDSLSDLSSFKGPIEQYITLGTGLNWVINLVELGYNETTKVIFTDINPLVLRFMKSLVENWDGNNYIEFYLQNIDFLPNNLPYDFDTYIDQMSEKWNNFRENYPDWLEMWNKVKKLSFEYISIDYMSNYNLDFIESNKNTICNVSDMFDHVPNVFIQSMKYRIAAENRFYNKLAELDKEIYVLSTSRSCSSLIENKESKNFDKVKNVMPIDIETICIPYWHQEDWKTLRPLV